MSTRSLGELNAAAEGLSLSVRVTRKWPEDVALESGLDGFYSVPVARITHTREEPDGTVLSVTASAFNSNPVPGAGQTFLGATLDDARAALRAMAKK